MYYPLICVSSFFYASFVSQFMQLLNIGLLIVDMIVRKLVLSLGTSFQHLRGGWACSEIPRCT